MKFIPLIWSGIWRKKGRTILIFLQVCVAFAMFGILQGMKTGMTEAANRSRADLLLVQPDAVGGAPMPVANLARLQAMPGVKMATFEDGFYGTYQKPDQPLYVWAIPSDDIWLTLYPEIFQVLPADLVALQRTRTGALISTDMAKKYHWRVGDRIPLTSATLQENGSGDWVFDIVGTYVNHYPGIAYLAVNYAYFNEARARNKDTVSTFYAVASNPQRASVTADAIDRTFANSGHATRTQSLRENSQQGVQAIGDLNFVVRTIVTAVLAAVLFSISTMMMQTIRERAPELAVLKTLGFTNRAVFLLVVAEAMVACITGAVVGLALALLVFPYAGKFIPGLSMPPSVIEAGLVGACVVALISVALPAFRAARLQVVDALAGR